MNIRFFFAWYDFWIGWYYNQVNDELYICPLPMCVINIWRDDGKRLFPRRCKYCGRWYRHAFCFDDDCPGSIPL